MRSALPLLVLALGLSLGPTARADAPTATTAPPERAEPARPATSLGPEVPRGAVARFLAACRDGQYAKAAEYLNLQQIARGARAHRGPQLARELETVLDHALVIDLDHVSTEPEGDPDDGLPPLRDSLGTIETAGGPVEIVLERVPQTDGAPVWKFSANTVAAIPSLYAEFGWGPLARVLPYSFFRLRFLGIRLWQWIGLAALLGAAWLASRLFRRMVTPLVRWVLARRPTLDGEVVHEAAGPLCLAIAIGVFAAGVRFLDLPLRVERGLEGVEKALAIVAVTWLLLRLLDALVSRFERRLDGSRHIRTVASVPLGRRTLKVFVAVVAFVSALQNFGFNVTGIIAGLGVGGLAVALAAQKTVENLFGSVSLVADQPVRVGDMCRFGDTVGTIEDIGLRSTRVRTLDRTVVTIPNAQFSTLALENLSRRDRMPVRATVALPHNTSAERVRQVLAALHDMLVAQPAVDAPSAHSRFVRMQAQALEIELFAYVHSARWEEFVEIREQIFLRALEVVGESGVTLK